MPKDKESTKKKLIAAVGDIFRTEGYHGLGVNKVARMAGVDKKLIYRYFGNIDGLIEAYVVETDYWMMFFEKMRTLEVPQNGDQVRRLLTSVLQDQFAYFLKDKEMQRLILWELSVKSPLMRSIHETRELMGKQLLDMTEPYLKNKTTNFRAVAALLVGGIYYIILHTRVHGGKFTDVDLSTDMGLNEILNAIEEVVSITFDFYSRQA
jgi:AcrR family transcriptional regulator